MKRSCIFTLMLFFVCMSVSATIINVPGNYPTIQAGINASTDGDTVLVQPGIYVENVTFNGHNIMLGSLFLTTADTSYISTTIIDGDSSGTVVVITGGEDSTTVITGFTIRNGASEWGGGINCSHSNPTIAHNIITENSADSIGGGIYCGYSRAIITHNTITGNSADNGGGIYCDYDSATITTNTISYNSATKGGGMYVYRSRPVFNHNIINDNSANTEGGGVYFHYCYDFVVKNCIIYRNTAFWNSGIGDYGSWVIITNSIVYYNDIEYGMYVTYSNVEGGWWRGWGNIDADPLFRDPDNGDFHLQDSINCGDPHYSPCIDTGNPGIIDRLLDCEWGLGDTLSDMGAYGGGGLVGNVIQSAIDASSNGDTVLIPPGRYYENINLNGKSIVLGSLFLATGDTSYISSTIIDGSSNFDFVVTIANGEDSTTAIIGFTITSVDPYRGGIYCSGADPTISYNYIIDNIIAYDCSGAGIFCDEGNVCITNNLIARNEAYGGDAGVSGGGMSISNCHAVIADNVISDNVASGGNRGSSGGGISIFGSSGIIRNNIISGNISERGGGIVYLNITAPIIGNLIVRNEATGGGGIFCMCRDQDTTTVIMNNTIVENEAGFQGGGGIDFTGIFVGDTLVRCISNIIWNNEAEIGPQIIGEPAEISYCNIQDTLYPGVGNMSVDPLFRDTLNNDFHLQDSIDCNDLWYSPCIDAGDPTIFDSLLSCWHGLGMSRSDMGAYGGSNSGWTGVKEDINDDPFIPQTFALHQNYPNPFNSSTVLKYSIPQSGPVSLRIYNVLGQRVATLYEGVQQSGVHCITWDVSDVSSGIYFARLQSKDHFKCIKLALLK